MDDTGWILLATDGSGDLKYRVKNGQCYVRFNAGSATGILRTSAGSYKTMGTIPEEYWPTVEVRAPLTWQSSETSTIFAKVQATDGTIQVYATMASNYYTGMLSYPIG